MRLTVRAERAGDGADTHAVNVAAFARRDEADLVDALREGGFVIASLVATDQDRIAGHVLFTRLRIESAERAIDAVALAPLAVVPEMQRRGVGSALVREGLRRLREAGETIVVVVGHPAYYPRFGFSAELAAPLRSVFSSPAMMALELVPGALRGVRGALRYADPFMVQSEVPLDGPHRPEA